MTSENSFSQISDHVKSAMSDQTVIVMLKQAALHALRSTQTIPWNGATYVYITTGIFKPCNARRHLFRGPVFWFPRSEYFCKWANIAFCRYTRGLHELGISRPCFRYIEEWLYIFTDMWLTWPGASLPEIVKSDFLQIYRMIKNPHAAESRLSLASYGNVQGALVLRSACALTCLTFQGTVRIYRTGMFFGIPIVIDAVLLLWKTAWGRYTSIFQ